MKLLFRFLGTLLPAGIRDVALADLERELDLRRAHHGERWTDRLWCVREAAGLVVRGWIVHGRDELGAPARLWTDVWGSIRALSRSPGLTLTAILVIALGVSAPTAMYSVGDALTRGLPVPEPEQLVTISHLSGRWNTVRRGLRAAELQAVRDAAVTLGDVVAHDRVMWDVGGETRAPERVAGARVTHDLLEVLRESPVLGRDFGPDDADRPVALIGEQYWRTRYGADPTVVGGSIRLNGTHHTVVGVLPAHLLFPAGAQIWVPLSGADTGPESADRRFATLARLPSGGASWARAQEEIVGLGIVASESEPGARFVLTRLYDRLDIDSSSRRFFLGMLAMVTCLLLVAAFNVTNLLLCRAVSRQHDIAVRTALGASRGRIAAMHLTEAAVISVVGGLLGFTLAIRGTELFRWAAADQIQWWMDVRTDTGMLWFALGLVVLSALLAGLVPAIQATRGDVKRGLHGTPHGGGAFKLTWMSERLVVLQVMFSAALLVQAVVIAGMFLDPADWFSSDSLETSDVLVAGYAFRTEERPAAGERFTFHKTLVEAVAERSGIRSAGLMTPYPGRTGSADWVVPAEYPKMPRYDRDRTQIVRMSPGALDVLGTSVLRGRDLTWTDGVSAPVVLINEEYAQRFFPDREPLGEEVRFVPPGGGDPITAAVVGVVPPLGAPRFEGGKNDAIYIPITIGSLDEAFVLLRAAPGRNPLSHLTDLRKTLDTIDPDKPLYSVGTLKSLMRRANATMWAIAGLFIFTGLAGILMSGTGLYAVMAFAVGRRTHEIGVRTALGASKARVLSAVLGRAGLHLAQGLFLGLILALGMADRFMFVERDPRIFATVAAGVVVTGLIAAAVPALRAVRVEPTVALRAD